MGETTKGKDGEAVNRLYAEKDVGKLLMSHSHDTKEESYSNADKPLDLPLRFTRVLSIILEQNPDVITLQELDHHYDFMLPELRKRGYDGLFQPKHVSKGAEFNGGLPDGVAIFWNTQTIKKTGETPVFSGSLHQPKKVSDLGVIENDEIVQAKQIALAVKLQTKDQREFLMMTAHVKSGESLKDIPVKMMQGKEVAGIIAKNNTGMPVIFACDFNNKPGGDAHLAFFEELLCKCDRGIARSNEIRDLQALNKQRAMTIAYPKAFKKLQKQLTKDELTAEEFEIAKKNLLPEIVTLSSDGSKTSQQLLTAAEFEKAKATVAQ